MWNKTGIVCTLGPASARKGVLLKLIAEGMDVARLNFSHGDLAQHGAAIRLVRDCARKSGRGIGMLQDLPGPKLRAGDFPGGALELYPGEPIALSVRPRRGFKHLPFPDRRPLRGLKPGADVWLADGSARLRVEAVRGDAALCRSLSRALVRSRCGVNIPGGAAGVAAFTARDRRFLAFGLKAGVDFVAVSFVGGPSDMRAARRAVAGARVKPLLVAKIERASAMQALPAIVRESDAVMVARGDLGLELPFARVPFAQKEIIAECRRQGRPVIVATQMLESMTSSPRPTRAELSDIANAVLDGADALMLSGETAVGKYPREAVAALAAVAREAEGHLRPELGFDHGFATAKARAIAAAAVALAEGIGAKAIVVPTFTGHTARCVCRLRPRCPIVALCAPGNESRLSLFWGVRAFVERGLGRGLEGVLAASRRAAARLGVARRGETIVVSCSLPGRRFAGDRLAMTVTV
ncbi:MAG: pyruvate kinase [Elusimicrobia bacterium]|nr:pyruvate kinase [Elusimicrobiota bacterium]